MTTLADEPVTIARSECVCSACGRVVPSRQEDGGELGQMTMPQAHEDADGERCYGEAVEGIEPWRYPRPRKESGNGNR